MMEKSASLNVNRSLISDEEEIQAISNVKCFDTA